VIPRAGVSAIASVVADGPAAGCRALDLRVWDGIDVRLLPDRGLDAGAAWFGGVPLAWESAVGERAASGDWLADFGGGLVTTCGLRNVGLPSEGHGQHGDFTFQRAAVEAVERTEDGVTVRGRIAEASSLAHHLEVERTWRTRRGEGLLELRDVTRNLGREAEPAPLLYHVNIGAPLWVEGSHVRVWATESRPRDADAEGHEPLVAPGVVPGARERVWEHVIAEPRAVVSGAGLELELTWEGLPRLWQWVHPAPGVEVLGLEPANCSVLGRGHDRAEGRLPVLEPGEERVTGLRIRVRGSRSWTA
jgi:Domain of unknown function (DUF4432)